MTSRSLCPANRRTSRAFTLVEMLIVISIVCLLAALLFPAFGHVRALGRRTTCASNLRQLGVALNQYAQDNRSFYPPINKTAFNNTERGCAPWADSVFPYVKTTQVFECPSYPLGSYKTGCPDNDLSDREHPIFFDGSYALNIPNAVRSVKDGNAYTHILPRGSNPIAITRYTRPSSTILVLDGDGSFVSPLTLNVPDPNYPPATDLEMLDKYGVSDRHEGGVNVAFADGHVKWMSLDSLLKLSLWKINGLE